MSEWPMVKLGDIFQPAPKILAGEIEAPILSITMHNGLVEQDGRFKKRIASTNTSTYRIVKRGQLVVGFPIDEGVLDFQEKYDSALVSPAYGVWNLVNNDVLPDFMGRYLRSSHAIATYKSRLQGTTARRRSLPTKVFQDIEVPLPPLGEQNRITKILGKVAESTRKIESELELLGRLPLFDWSWTGENQKLADVVIVRSGTVDPTLPENQKLLLIAPDSIERDTGNLLELKTCEEAGVTSGKYHFHRGDVLYSKIRPYLNKVAIAPCDGLCSADMYALETKGNLTPETLQAILMSRQFLAYTSQTSGRASIPKVNRKTLLAYEVPKLSNAQIFEITKKIQTVNKVRALLHQKLALLKELQYSLSARAFAGQL